MNGEVINNSTFAAELSASADTIVTGPYTFFLKTLVWRDFMAGGGENSSSLICNHELTNLGGSAISNSVILKKQYIVLGNETWISTFSDVHRDSEHIIRGVARKGPLWKPGTYVHIICEFENNGETFRIISKAQRIGATY